EVPERSEPMIAPAPSPVATRTPARRTAIRPSPTATRPPGVRVERARGAIPPPPHVVPYELAGPTVKVHLPHRFYYDHAGRDLPSGRVVKVCVQSIYVELDGATYDELMADAALYISGGTEEFPGYGGLISSAR